MDKHYPHERHSYMPVFITANFSSNRRGSNLGSPSSIISLTSSSSGVVSGVVVSTSKGLSSWDRSTEEVVKRDL